jgi:hypothetical protein
MGGALTAHDVVALIFKTSDDANTIGAVFKGLQQSAYLELAGTRQAINSRTLRETILFKAIGSLGNGLLRGVMATKYLYVRSKTHLVSK